MRRGGNCIAATLLSVALAMVGTGASMSARGAHGPDAPTQLTADDDAQPLAVADDPAFGWLPHDADRGEVQSAYEIVVSDSDGPNAHVVADTHEVTSDQQTYVHVPGLLAKLQADHSYWWKLRTWDRNHEASPYSALARFDRGLTDTDWKASWIRRPGAEKEPVEDYSFIRRTVDVGASPVTRARVYASAGHQYDFAINGVRRAHGPSFAYPDEQYYETTDITADVKAGARNVFAFTTWWGQPGQGRPASVPALIAQISIEHADGSRELIATDSSWRTHTAGRVQDVPRNDEGDFVEHVDERRISPGWALPAFDDASWAPAAVLGPAGTKPFTHLIAARTHIVEQRIKPVSLHRVGTAWVADFGAVISATPVVNVHRGRAGAAVTVLGGYQLDPGGKVSTTKGIQDTNMAWHFDERAGAQELRPFGYLAFRYLEVDGARGEQLTTDDIQIDARHANFPDENAARFETSDATLNAVWNLARHSALYDAQEQFVDTPTREKGPFLGDSFNVSQATMAAFGERALTFQSLRDFARSQARYWPDGRVNVVYPNGDGKRDIPDATQTYVQWVWHYWMTTGDRAVLATLYPVVSKIADYVARAVDPKTGLVTKLPGGGEDYLYGSVDWPQWMRYGYDMNTTARTMINVLAVEDFRAVGMMAQVLDRSDDAQRQVVRTIALQNAINGKLTRPNGVYIDGLEADGSQSTHASQQANAWALAVGIVPAEHEQAVANKVVALGSAMGVVYYRELLDALHNAGRDDALVRTLTDASHPGYAQILKQGATFTWESWIAPEVGDSESHGWGSTVLAVLQDDILGVRTSAAGASVIDVHIPKSAVTHATGVVSTQRGPVPITWTRDAAGHETIDITVPTNMAAGVHVDNANGFTTSDDGRPIAKDAGVAYYRSENGGVTLLLGSGHYVLANTAPTKPALSDSSSSHTLLIVVIILAVLLLGAGAIVLVVRRRRRAA